MKVYYNGFNLYRQFPSDCKVVENFTCEIYKHSKQIEVSYHFAVLLVADHSLIIRGTEEKKIEIGEISKISCTEDKILVLLLNGELVNVLNNVTKVPKLENLDSEDYITQLSAGSKLTIALTKNGYLYNIPNKLNFKKDIIDIKTGREHCLLLDKHGSVFSFGRGSRGQLGHGCLDDEVEPKFVEALGGIKIKAIATGGWHSCALSENGDLYIWGWNGNGQLGLSEDENVKENIVSVMATPQVVDLNFNIKKVGCGVRHTVVLAGNGMLYGCGWNKYKQLKNDNQQDFFKMVFLKDYSNEVVTDLKTGPWNTLVLCEE